MTRNILSILTVITVFIGYVFATVSPANAFVTQQRYRWRYDDAGEALASWRAAANAPYLFANADLEETLRLRFELNAVGAGAVVNLGLEYSADAGATWQPVMTDGSTGSHWMYTPSLFMTHEEPTTAQMGAGVAGTFIPGLIIQGMPTAPFNLDVNEKTEIEYVLRATDNVHENTLYLFRIPGMDLYLNSAILNANCLAKVTDVNDAELCSPGTGALLEATGLWGNQISWYDSDDNYLGDGASFMSPALFGPATFYAEAWSLFGCLSEKVPVYVNPVTIDVATTSGFVCESGSVTLSTEYIPASATATWYSDADATTLVFTGDVFVTPTLTDSTEFYVMVSTDYCNSLVYPVLAEVRALPELTITPDRDTACVGEFVSFVGTIDPNYTYLWSDGTTTAELLTNVYGTHSLTVTDVLSTCQSSAEIFLDTVVAPTIEGFDFVPMYHTDFKIVSFSPLEATGVTGYHWDFGDGITSTDMEPTHTYADSGTYIVTLTVSNECYDIPISLEIYVRPKNTSVEDLNWDKAISIFPNPAHSVLNIHVDNTEKISQITLVNVAGQIVFNEHMLPTTDYTLRMSEFARGNYLLIITGESGRQSTKQVVLQ